MIKTQLKFEAKIPNCSKVVEGRNYTKFLSFKVKITSFPTHLRYLDEH